MTYDTDNRQIGYEKKKEGTARLNQWSLVSAHKDTSGSTSGLIDEGAIVINTAEGLFPIHVRLHVRLIELDKDDKISECGFKKGEQEIWKSGSTLWMYSRSFIQKSAIIVLWHKKTLKNAIKSMFLGMSKRLVLWKIE